MTKQFNSISSKKMQLEIDAQNLDNDISTLENNNEELSIVVTTKDKEVQEANDRAS